jgi:hypothetical protein
MVRIRIVVLTAVLLVLGPGLAAAQIAELEGRGWVTDFKAAAKLEGSGLEGTRVDFEKDLGIDSDEMPELRFSFGLGGSRIRAAYGYANLEGDKTLEQTISFEGRTFNATDRVRTEIGLHYGRIGWIWTPTIIPGIFRIGPIVELKGFLADISLESNTVSEEATLPIVLPTIGGATDVTIGQFQVFAEVSGLPAGDYGYLVDGEAGVRWIPIRFFTAFLGYRLFDVRVGDDDDYGRMRLSGPYLGLSLRF